MPKPNGPERALMWLTQVWLLHIHLTRGVVSDEIFQLRLLIVLPTKVTVAFIFLATITSLFLVLFASCSFL